MRRAKPFFPWCSKEKKLLHNGSSEACRVLFYFLCMFVSIKIVIGHLGRPRSTRTALMPAPICSVHAQIITKPSRAGFGVSCSKLVEPVAATCVFRGMAGPCLKSLEHTSYIRTRYKYQFNNITVLLCSGKNSAEQGLSQQLSLQVGRPCP